MAAHLLPDGGIALVGAPDAHPSTPLLPAMHVEITQDIVDELLASVKSGKPPQLVFGRTPQLKYGDRTHVLQSSSETHTNELYTSSGSGSAAAALDFAGLITHNLIVQEAEDVTAGVDSALAQLKSSMAAISEFKEANKTIVGHATPVRTPGHRRFPSTSFRAQHPAAKVGSPLLDTPTSSMTKRPPTSQPAGTHDAILKALRVPIIHLLAREPATDVSLAATCRTSTATMRDLLPKIAKRSTQDTDKWQLTDKSFREITPWNFPYSTDADREQAIEGAIKAFDRLRLTKDDKLWQILLPREERGQGKCLSRSKVKPLEAKPKASTPLHKVSDFTKKKAIVAKKSDDKVGEKKPRATKDPETKPIKSIKEKTVAREKPTVKDVKDQAPATSTTTSASKPTTLQNRTAPSADASKIRTKKAPVPEANSTPRTKPKMAPARDLPQERTNRPVKPIYNTKPKNPSPLSASPPVNASDFADSHPVHKALAAAASPAKTSYGNSDRTLKRKANDIDSDIHNHGVVLKKAQVDRAGANRTPSQTNGKLNGSTPSSSASLKRKSDESSTSNTPSAAPKVRRVANINTGLASRYTQNNNSHHSPSDSSSTTSPTQSALSFRQTVELSQKFQRYYIKYEELYWRLTEASSPPTEAQRKELLNMHKKLEEMKREIKAGARMQR